jgi:DNA-binding transcriptional LysR family regulator
VSRLDTVDLRLLRVFATVVEARGFTAAQTILNVSGSTISNQISALETRLGVKLCRRGRAGFKLTEDGELIFSSICGRAPCAPGCAAAWSSASSTT